MEIKSIELLNDYPKLDKYKVERELEKMIQGSRRKIVVLDDDPTGTQTVCDISVYTDWTYESVKAGFQEKSNLFYILTNSRSMSANRTKQVHKEIAEIVLRVSKELQEEFMLVSRSDSTLRGHYPLETQCIKDVLEKSDMRIDGEILCFYFKEGGRYTIDNIHYVKMGNSLVPAGDTEFAKDATFGYRESDLRAYIEEKTKGEYKKQDVVCITLKSLREHRIEAITNQLLKVQDFQKVIVNAIDDCDVEVFCIALYEALKQGKHYLYRTAAAFVKAAGGVKKRRLLTQGELFARKAVHNGLIVVGSHTKKTTEQLEILRQEESVYAIEFNSDLVLDEKAFGCEIQRVIAECEESLAKGRITVVYTRRKILEAAGDSKEEALQISVKISGGLQKIVEGLKIQPDYIIAKGGITSSDIGVKALGVKRARVLGQIAPGIPVWITGDESRFPGMPYIIFPGNVGESVMLKNVVRKIMYNDDYDLS